MTNVVIPTTCFRATLVILIALHSDQPDAVYLYCSTQTTFFATAQTTSCCSCHQPVSLSRRANFYGCQRPEGLSCVPSSTMQQHSLVGRFSTHHSRALARLRRQCRGALSRHAASLAAAAAGSRVGGATAAVVVASAAAGVPDFGSRCVW